MEEKNNMSNIPEAITREEQYYEAIAGKRNVNALPKPITRQEMYLNAIANNISNIKQSIENEILGGAS